MSAITSDGDKAKPDVDSILQERGKKYGDYGKMAGIAQDIKRRMRDGTKFHGLSVKEQESLDLIATKIARVVEGGGTADEWLDIQGYANLGGRAHG